MGVSVKSADPERLKTKIFSKGLSIYESGKIRSDGESEKTAYFTVEGDHEQYQVRVGSDGTFNCTCMRGTLLGPTKGIICSHVIAAIIFLSRREEKRE